jgi:hypothetical protein
MVTSKGISIKSIHLKRQPKLKVAIFPRQCRSEWVQPPCRRSTLSGSPSFLDRVLLLCWLGVAPIETLTDIDLYLFLTQQCFHAGVMLLINSAAGRCTGVVQGAAVWQMPAACKRAAYDSLLAGTPKVLTG